MAASFQDLLGYIQAQEATLQALRCKSKSQILGLETLCEQSITNCIVLCNCRGCLFSNKIYCIGQVGKENCLPDSAAVRSTVTEAFEHFAATVDELMSWWPRRNCLWMQCLIVGQFETSRQAGMGLIWHELFEPAL